MCKIAISFFLCCLILISCKKDSDIDKEEEFKYIPIEYNEDPHSYSNPNEVVITHLDLDINVDFNSKSIKGTALYQIYNDGYKSLILDTKHLDIEKVEVDGEKASFKLGDFDPILGRSLTIDINQNSKKVKIYYSTTKKSEALQWLDPVQTEDKTHPFLYTQGQPILTRTWIPIQDSPQVRIRYSANVRVPGNLLAVMSAKNPIRKNDSGLYNFKMTDPIPAYLIVLAVGNLEYLPISFRTGVYAEPSIVKSAKKEFEDVEEMIQITEQLFGRYQWEQYDLLILPPSFPYGGMENPRLSFISPTTIAGDKSLNAIIAHELAHSWSGNLVTNASWNDFWLNEGFTVYIENRIIEELYGKERADMLAFISKQDLLAEIENLKESKDDTKLKLNLQGRDPDAGMNSIAYEKGFLFLKTLEEKVGRELWDVFLQSYFSENEFKSMDTESFVSYLNKMLLEPNKLQFNVEEWIYEPGIPENSFEVNTDNFKKVESLSQNWRSGQTIYVDNTTGWSPQEWVHFITNLPKDMDLDTMRRLDEAFHFSNSINSYIAMTWYEQAILRDYHENEIDKIIKDFLVKVGRSWYVTTLYRAYADVNKTEYAKEIYRKAKPNYHSVTQQRVETILNIE